LCEPAAPADAARRRRTGPHRLDSGDRGIRGTPARRIASGDPWRAPRASDGAGPLPRAVLGRVRRVRARLADVLISLVAHDLLRKPVPTFRDHALPLSSFSAAACTRLSPAAT